MSERTLIVKIPLTAARTQIYNSDQQAHKCIVSYAPFALEFGRKRHKPMIYKPRGCFAEKVANSVRRPIERKRLRLGPSILQRASAQNNIPTAQLWKSISPGLDDRHRLLSIQPRRVAAISTPSAHGVRLRVIRAEPPLRSRFGMRVNGLP